MREEIAEGLAVAAVIGASLALGPWGFVWVGVGLTVGVLAMVAVEENLARPRIGDLGDRLDLWLSSGTPVPTRIVDVVDGPEWGAGPQNDPSSSWPARSRMARSGALSHKRGGSE